MTRTLLIPAAGRGTRLGSSLPKLLTMVADRPMIDWILDRHRPHCASTVLVVHPDDRSAVEAHLQRFPQAIALAEQPAPSGMLDAVLCGRERALEIASDRVWITWCDQLLISASTVSRLAALEAQTPGALAILPTSRQPHPYIHFERDDRHGLQQVWQRREGDPMPDIGESDAGLFSLSREALARYAPLFAREAPPGRLTHERNFLPFLPWLAARGEVVTFDVASHESLGVNTPDDLAKAGAYLAQAKDR